jgi:hypothetical protein
VVYRYARCRCIQNLHALTQTWQTFLNEQKLPDNAVERARYFFGRPGILSRVCPLVIPRLSQAAASLRRDGEFEAAATAYRKIVALIPNHPSPRLGVLANLASMGHVEAARSEVDALMKLDGLSPVILAKAQVLLADARWRKQDYTGALNDFRKLRNSPLSEGEIRTIEVKIYLLEHPEREATLGPYLLGSTQDEAQSYLVDALLDAPENPVTTYLLARRYAIDGLHLKATRLFEPLLDKLDHETSPLWQSIRRESRRLLARSYFQLDKLAEAERAYQALGKEEIGDAENQRIQDWLERLKWLRDRKR